MQTIGSISYFEGEGGVAEQQEKKLSSLANEKKVIEKSNNEFMTNQRAKKVRKRRLGKL